MRVTNVKNRVVAIGNNLFESGVINVPAQSKITAGTLLKREESGKFSPVLSDEDTPVAVMPYDLENSGDAAADCGFRALTSGRVRADMLTVDGSITTAAQNDALRSYTIIPIKVTDLSQLDNQ
jgi:hypothetical protein